MDENAARLARKISALIAKAEGTDNEHEAASFMAKAREMMEAHSLEESDIRDARNPQYTLTLEAPYSANWYKNVATAGAAYYGAQVVFYRTGTRFLKLELYGRQAGVVTAHAMIPYLWREVVRSGNVLRKGSTPSEKRKAIRMVGDALAQRVLVQALARDGAVDELKESGEFMNKKVPGVRTVETKAAVQTRETIAAARDISIHLQTTAHTPEKLQ